MLAGVLALVSVAFTIRALGRSRSAELCPPVYPAPDSCTPGGDLSAVVLATAIVVLAFGGALLAVRSRRAAVAVPLALTAVVVAAAVTVWLALVA